MAASSRTRSKLDTTSVPMRVVMAATTGATNAAHSGNAGAASASSTNASTVATRQLILQTFICHSTNLLYPLKTVLSNTRLKVCLTHIHPYYAKT